jgi:hypothetical protein
VSRLGGGVGVGARRKSRSARWAVLGLFLTAFGCGGARAIIITADRADPAIAAAALARIDPPAPGPANRSGRALAFLVTAGPPRSLISYDLEARRERWRVAAPVVSPVAVGGSFVAAREADRLVARDLASGRALWSRAQVGQTIGTAADGDRLFVAEARDQRAWALRALDGRSGRELWRVDSPGALGPPAARGGIVVSSFVEQWITVLDGATGDELARLRAGPRASAGVRAGGDGIVYGGRAGLFRLGRAGERPIAAPLIPRAGASLDPMAAAPDRPMLLWRARGSAIDRAVVHAGTCFAGVDVRAGSWMWVQHHHGDLIGAAHVGPVVLFATADRLGALDPLTGRAIDVARLPDPIAAATFDAEGWRPSGILAPGPGASATPIAE